jgi:hypothetical protein
MGTSGASRHVGIMCREMARTLLQCGREHRKTENRSMAGQSFCQKISLTQYQKNRLSGLNNTESQNVKSSDQEWGGHPGTEGDLSSPSSMFTVTYCFTKDASSTRKVSIRKDAPNWSITSLDVREKGAIMQVKPSSSLKTSYPNSKCLGIELHCACGGHHSMTVEYGVWPAVRNALLSGLTLTKRLMRPSVKSQQSPSTIRFG